MPYSKRRTLTSQELEPWIMAASVPFTMTFDNEDQRNSFRVRLYNARTRQDEARIKAKQALDKAQKERLAHANSPNAGPQTNIAPLMEEYEKLSTWCRIAFAVSIKVDGPSLTLYDNTNPNSDHDPALRAADIAIQQDIRNNWEIRQHNPALREQYPELFAELEAKDKENGSPQP